MRIGLGLPNAMPEGIDRGLLIDWARLGDEAGFEVLGVIDRPDYDSWEPLATLAGVAAVTSRIRLATTILQLPNRNPVSVAKQVAVIDRLSQGRCVLGVGLGHRPNDYEAMGSSFHKRAETLSRHIDQIRRLWEVAREASAQRGVLGPAPVQVPGPPIWIGGSSRRSVQRGLAIGDGFIFGEWSSIELFLPWLLEEARRQGRSGFTIAALANVAVGKDPREALDQARPHIVRYFGRMPSDPNFLHRGPGELIGESVAKYAEAGVDVLILVPQIPDLMQVERLGEDVLPLYH